MASAVVFDFDGTLAIKEAGDNDLKRALTVEGYIRDKVFGGQKRVDMIKKLLETLAKKGVSCVILSYNKVHIIKRMLCAHGVEMQKHFESIIAREEMFAGGMAASKKSRWIRIIMQRLGITSASRIFFLDDTADNARDVMTSLPESCTHWVKHDDGLRESHCDAILLWAELLKDAPVTNVERHIRSPDAMV